MAFTIESIRSKKAAGTACDAEEPQGNKKRSPYLLPCLIGLFCLLLVGGVFIWNRVLLSASDSGATVASYHGKTKEELQAELDREASKNSMVISIAPVATIQEDGRLRVNLYNDELNKLPQRFAVIQDGRTLFRSGVIKPGEGVEFCQADGIGEGDAEVEIQALDKDALTNKGNPTRVKVRVERA